MAEAVVSNLHHLPPVELPDRQLDICLELLTREAFFTLTSSGKVATWNKGARRLFGHEQREIINQPFARLLAGRNVTAGLLARAQKQGVHETACRVRRKDKSEFLAALVLKPIITGGAHTVTGFACLIRDRTQPDQTHEQPRSTERQPGFPIEDVVDDALCRLDPQGIVMSWNAGAEQIKGYRAEEIIGRHFSVFYTLEDRAIGLPQQVLAAALAHGKYTAEATRVRKDGSRFVADIIIFPVFDQQGNHIGFAKSTRDVTDRKAAASALAESRRQHAILEERQRGLEQGKRTNQLLTKIIEASPMGLVTVDRHDQIVIWNPAEENITGVKAADVVGRRVQDIIAEMPGTIPDCLPERLEAIRRDGRLDEIDIRRRRPDGKIIDTVQFSALLPGDEDEAAGVLFVVEDATRRKDAEGLLQQAQKLDAIGRLSGGIAHDFNNLLAIIQGNLELLQDSLLQDPSLAELINDATAAARRGAQLTHRLLAYSRQQQLAPQTVNFVDRAKELVSMLRRVLEESINIDTALPRNLWPTHIDVDQLDNAIINLAINARDAMPNGGRLTISGENLEIDAELAAHADVQPGAYVVLSISDTGVGMPPEIVSRALEPFFSTKAVGKGTGLGLSMVYGFVKQSGGHLTIYSEPGIGTTVKLYLPRAIDEPASVAVEEAPKLRTVNQHEHVILVVEDDESVRRLQVRMLQSLGFETIEASDGVSALEVLLSERRIDLMLSDVVLPNGVNGLQIAEAACQLRPGLKVLFMSGYAADALAHNESFAGATVLSKPFARYKLAQAIWEMLRN